MRFRIGLGPVEGICLPSWLILMFDALQDRLQKVFKTLRIQGVLNDEVVDQTLREVRLALLDADVNLNVVKELLDRVRVKALGEEVRSSLSPVQEVIRIVRDELIEILGREASLLTFSKEYPTVFLMVGLQGSGKTTTSGKLALWLAGRKRRPMLVSTDVYRPAAREQLAVIAKAIQIPIFAGDGHQLAHRIGHGRAQGRRRPRSRRADC